MNRLHLPVVVLTALVVLASPAIATCARTGAFMDCGPDHVRRASPSCHEESVPEDCCLTSSGRDVFPSPDVVRVDASSPLSLLVVAAAPERPSLRLSSTASPVGPPGAGEARRYALFSAFLL